MDWKSQENRSDSHHRKIKKFLILKIWYNFCSQFLSKIKKFVKNQNFGQKPFFFNFFLENLKNQNRSDSQHLKIKKNLNFLKISNFWLSLEDLKFGRILLKIWNFPLISWKYQTFQYFGVSGIRHFCNSILSVRNLHVVLFDQIPRPLRRRRCIWSVWIKRLRSWKEKNIYFLVWKELFRIPENWAPYAIQSQGQYLVSHQLHQMDLFQLAWTRDTRCSKKNAIFWNFFLENFNFLFFLFDFFELFWRFFFWFLFEFFFNFFLDFFCWNFFVIFSFEIY